MISKRWLILIFSILLCIFTIGCSEKNKVVDADDTNAELDVDEEGEEKEKERTNKQEPEVDETEAFEQLESEAFRVELDNAVAWMETGPGQYSGKQYDEEAIKSEIANWPEGLSAEEYFYHLLALTAEDFTKYQTFLDETEVVFANISERPDGKVSEEDQKEQANLHVQVLLDASGSMAGQVDGGIKMDLAKEAIAHFVSELPENVQVSLRVYGHKGSNQLDGKEESCSKTEEIYPLGDYSETEFSKALEKFGPTGYTPIAGAMEAAGKDLEKANTDGVKSVIYVVSDGEETCGGDPVAVAKDLQDSDIGAIVNIIGFDIEESERKALEAIAEAGAGEYLHADTAQELQDTFRQERSALISDWQVWQSENVQLFTEQQSDYVSTSSDYQSEAVDLSNTEENRQLDLTQYMEEIMEEVDSVGIRNHIRRRALLIRNHVRDEYLAIRNEARDKGLELRNKVREEGLDERNSLRNQN